MTVQELIDVLNTFEDKSLTVKLSTSEGEFNVGCALQDNTHDDECVWIFPPEEEIVNGTESK